MEINDILVEREKKYNLIKKYINDYQIITLKSNIVGSNKKLPEAYILLSIYDRLIPNNYFKKIVLDNSDGPMIIYLFAKTKSLKEDMIQIEESTPLGRFVDIDVFFDSVHSLSREKLRKCYLCDNPAFVCGKLKTHSVVELNEYMKVNVYKYLTEIIYSLANESVLCELNLHPKFGLVTPFTNGSHKDMDYQVMIKAKDAILPYFIKMFEVGYNFTTFEKTFKNIRKLGVQAENAMFLAINGINAYKGLIFALGLIIAGVAINLSNLKEKRSYLENIQKMTIGITQELKNGNDTFGKIAYQEYNIGGARYEAERGFPIIYEVINKFHLQDDKNLTEALGYIIANIDDTVLLKRCGSLDLYNQVKNMFKSFDYDDLQHLNQYCLDNNLSFGGSADLLIVSVFIKKLNNLINFNLFTSKEKYEEK